jgi:hypothetical protein
LTALLNSNLFHNEDCLVAAKQQDGKLKIAPSHVTISFH